MQIASSGGNLHEMSKPCFLGKKSEKIPLICHLSEFAHRVVMVNGG